MINYKTAIDSALVVPMSRRELFLDFVKNGGRPVCSPQIGAGAGFDTRLAGKEWISETTLEDTIAAVERFDIVPLIAAPLCDLGLCNPAICWEESVSCRLPDRTITDYVLNTPEGALRKMVAEDKYSSGVCLEPAVRDCSDLPALDYYIDAAIDSDFSAVTDHTRSMVSTVDGRAALCVQWPVQPYELLCFPSTVDNVMLAHDCPLEFGRLMDKILALDEKIISAVAEGGADFIFLGGPAAEMVSPSYYEDYIIPYSQQASAMAHSHGMMVYSHICSPIEPFLSMGFYNRMGIDLFETLSPPPVGNVESLKDAMEKIAPTICTRGNLGLDILLGGSTQEIVKKTIEIVAATAGRKHMVAASDYLFYQVSEENVEAMVEAVRICNS